MTEWSSRIDLSRNLRLPGNQATPNAGIFAAKSEGPRNFQGPFGFQNKKDQGFDGSGASPGFPSEGATALAATGLLASLPNLVR